MISIRALFFSFLAISVTYAAEFKAPELTSPVIDQVGLLSSAESAHLDQVLRALNSQGRAQMTILVTSSLQGLPIEDYSIRVASAWKLGQKQTDRGLILVIAPQDHQMRLEVGYGLEGDLPDATSRRILDDVIKPYFKDSQYAQGIEAGVADVAKRLGMTTQGSGLDPQAGAAPRGRKNSVGGFAPLLLFGLFALMQIGVVAAVTALAGGVLGALACAILGLGTAWLGGVLGGIAGLILGAVFFRSPRASSGLRSGGFFGGFGGGGWGGGGLGGGGSWGGGGGGFGGGGASSSW